MSGFTTQLINYGGPALTVPRPWNTEEQNFLSGWGSLGDELEKFLQNKNGFYAFESALLVRPLTSSGDVLGLKEWNDPELWIKQYSADLKDFLFFAEDLFGCQFALSKEGVVHFEPEQAQHKIFCSSLEQWCELILQDYDLHTGFSLAHTWQKANAPLKPGHRLLPKVPFVVGGEYKGDNLYSSKDVLGMRFCAKLANQIQDIPDGTKITFKITE
jgi:hypothetical protein